MYKYLYVVALIYVHEMSFAQRAIDSLNSSMNQNSVQING